MEMSTAEEQVRAAWKYVEAWVHDLDRYGTTQFYVALFLNASYARWCGNHFQRWQEDDTPEGRCNAWQAALEFTLARQEEIRQIDEEIAYINSIMGTAKTTNPTHCILRILARLQAIRADLTRGMKEMGTTAQEEKSL